MRSWKCFHTGRKQHWAAFVDSMAVDWSRFLLLRFNGVSVVQLEHSGSWQTDAAGRLSRLRLSTS